MAQSHRQSPRPISRRSALGGLLGLGATPFVREVGALARAPEIEESLVVTGSRPELREAMTELFAGFETETGINVIFLAVSTAEYFPLVQQALTAGGIADVIGMPEGVLIRDSTKQILPLTDSLAIERILPSARAQIEFDGAIWGCPLESYSVAVYYHRSLLGDRAIPTTWTEFRDLCAELDGAGMLPLIMPSANATAPYHWYCLAATSLLGAEGWTALLAGEVGLDDPRLVPAAELVVDLARYDAKLGPTTDYFTGLQRFASQEAVMTVGTSNDLATFLDFDPDLDLGVFGFPPLESGPPTTLTGLELIYVASAFSFRTDAALALTAWLVSDDAQRVVVDRLALPIIAGLTPTEDRLEDRIKRDFLAARQADFPVWYAMPKLEQTFLTASQTVGSLIAGELLPVDFAGLMQARISQCPPCPSWP